MMKDRSDGYVQGLNYPYGYFPELNPLRVRLALLNAGFVPPANMTACELGFGQGVSANLYAAASATQWWGTDFNSAQAGFAQQLAAASGADAKFFDQPFAEFCLRPDLPDFDFIGLHGVWTWTSDESRAVIVDFVRRKLKAGGVVYIGYNALQASVAMLPIRDVLLGFADSMTAPGPGLVGRIDAALTFTEKLLAHSPLFTQANPQIVERLRAVRNEDPSYVAHEYFNRNWVPMSFARMAEWLAPAKLDYACSASFFHMVDALNLTTEQQGFLKDIPDAMLRETARDLMVNRLFRRDYWVKGARGIALPEKFEALRKERVMLIRQRADVILTAKGALREMVLPQSICEPLLDILGDHRPKTLGQIELEVAHRGIDFSQLLELVLALVETGNVASVQDERAVGAARKQTDRLNSFLCDHARHSADTCMLASPATGAAMAVDRPLMFFLHALRHGGERPADMAAHVLPICRAAGIGFRDGARRLESDDEVLAKIAQMAAIFLERQLPLLKALQIA